MNHQHQEAKLSTEEIAEIRRNMKARGLTHVFCQACSEEMKPEQARKSSTGLIMCRPCYMCNDTDATQEEIDQAIEEDFPGYFAFFNQRYVLSALNRFEAPSVEMTLSAKSVHFNPRQKSTHPSSPQVNLITNNSGKWKSKSGQ